MNNKLFLIPVAAAALALTACSNDGEPPVEKAKYITVSTNIDGLSRMANNDGVQTFTEGDQISIYAWTGDAATAPLENNRVVNNAINTLTSGVWVAEPQMLWKDMVTPHYFIGVYPSATTPVSNLTAADYTFDVADQTASDLLVATNVSGINASNSPVPLTFNHVMAKLIVNLEYRNQWGGTPTVENVRVEDTANGATVNYLTQDVKAWTTNKVELTLPTITANAQYASIVIPQKGVSVIHVRIGGKDYTYRHNSDIRLESGKYTTVNLIVGRDEITLGDITINKWVEGDEINGGEAMD